MRRVTWVCGDQHVLVEEVVTTIRQILAPSPMDYLPIHVTDVDERDVWFEASQYPLTPGAVRMILIRDAEQLTQWNQLDNWLTWTRRLPNIYLIFVSNEPDLPYETVEGKRAGLKPHAVAIRAPRGRLVRCVMPNEADALAWVRRRANLDDDTARYLLTRTGGDLALAASVCAKVSLFNGAAGYRTVDALCHERPSASFVDCLLALEKKQALLRVPDLIDNEVNKVIGLLDSRLDLLQLLYRAQAAGQHLREISGVNPYLARQYIAIARHYEHSRCAYRRRVLAVVDDALRSGIRDGVWEALVALW